MIAAVFEIIDINIPVAFATCASYPIASRAGLKTIPPPTPNPPTSKPPKTPMRQSMMIPFASYVKSLELTLIWNFRLILLS